MASSAAAAAKPTIILPKKLKADAIDRVEKSEDEWKKELEPLQFRVTRKHGTEPSFCGGNFEDNKTPGVYVSVCSGIPLFSSDDKFDSGSGWPSFVKPLEGAPVGETRDVSHGMTRVEVHCDADDAHLGHVFTDGPRARGGLRYCINGASLRFVPYDEIEASGVSAWFEDWEEVKQANSKVASSM